MATFKYTAIDSKGKRVSGKITAPSNLEAIRMLTSRGITVVDLSEVRTDKKPFLDIASLFTISTAEIATFSRQLATMVGAGVRVRDALVILSEQPVFSKRFRNYIRNISISLEQGKSLADAFEEQKVFDPLFINMARAGESGGVLDEVLQRIASFYEGSLALQNEVKSAMSYPKFIFMFAVGLVLVITVFILPNLIAAFGTMPKTGIINFLMALNALIKTRWPALLALLAGAYIGYKTFMKTRAGRSLKDFFGSLIPPIRVLRNDMAIERFCKTFATLIESGVGLEDALSMAAEVSESPKLIKAISNVIEDVRGGDSVSNAMAKQGVFPQLVVSMIETGEETGRISEVMHKVAAFYEDRVRAGIKRVVSLVEPMMIIMIGGFIAFLAYTMYTAIFSLQQVIG
ncbi:MAG: type pilus assembly protein PilC [Thermotogota bacterium]|nr:type pilus assembly protein PilC [Thermotogota bacterium]MDK2864029.1 type pilus assembly protein PilC [Thermotogota bacterium]HCZ06237.1 type II secretion system F family protein [Thermotogota bacterium]